MNAQSVLNQHADALTSLYGPRANFAVMLYGSQNYNLSTPQSDVDSKAMVLPSFGDFALKQKWLSVEHEVTGGLMNVKDIRAMFENFLKSNVNFLECLYTKYLVVSPTYKPFWDELVEHRDFIANAHPLRVMHAAAGMAAQKYHALEKPFESKAEVLAKYGYDPKQLHHLCRLRFLMMRYFTSQDFGAVLVPNTGELVWLRSLKTDPLPLEEARKEAKFAMEGVDNLVAMANAKFDKNPAAHQEAKKYLDNLALRLLRAHLVNELSNGAELS